MSDHDEEYGFEGIMTPQYMRLCKGNIFLRQQQQQQPPQRHYHYPQNPQPTNHPTLTIKSHCWLTLPDLVIQNAHAICWIYATAYLRDVLFLFNCAVAIGFLFPSVEESILEEIEFARSHIFINGWL